MGYNSVKNMPRKQQKAVFARMGKDKYLDRLEGAEKYHRRRQYLIQRKDLEENTEDKIFQVMNNKALTHRQKMVKIAEIKKAAAKKLSGHKATEESQTIVSEIREGQKKRFAGQEAENRKKLLKEMSKKRYQVRGLFPPGDMSFDTKKEALKFAAEKRKEGYKVDKEIYVK